MSRRFLILAGALAGLVGLAGWLMLASYKPSPDGLTEEAVALSDMQRYCQAAKFDCKDLRVQERIAPVRGKGAGHWEFVVRIGETGPRYMVAVTPGVESQVAPLGPP